MYFALEPIIVSRLLTACPALATAQGVADVYAITEQAQKVNAVTNAYDPLTGVGNKFGTALVCFWGEQVQQSRNDGFTAAQTWIIAVCSNRVQNSNSGQLARVENGVLVEQVTRALAGWDYSNALSNNSQAHKLLNARMHLQRVDSPLNRHQLPPNANGVVVTLLAYQAKHFVN